MSEQDPDPERDESIVPCPATIHTKSGPFYVKDVNAWRMDSHGALANGFWADVPGSQEQDVWFPMREIRWISYHWDQLAYYMENQGEQGEPALALVSND